MLHQQRQCLMVEIQKDHFFLQEIIDDNMKYAFINLLCLCFSIKASYRECDIFHATMKNVTFVTGTNFCVLKDKTAWQSLHAFLFLIHGCKWLFRFEEQEILKCFCINSDLQLHKFINIYNYAVQIYIELFFKHTSHNHRYYMIFLFYTLFAYDVIIYHYAPCLTLNYHVLTPKENKTHSTSTGQCFSFITHQKYCIMYCKDQNVFAFHSFAI